MKNLPTTEVQQIVNTGITMSGQSAEERARETVALIAENGRRWDRQQSD